jgi:hypothetical protein
MKIPHTFLKSDNTEISAFCVGIDIIPHWAIELNRDSKIEFLNEDGGIAIKIDNKIANHGDYILNINDKLSIMTADKFEKMYSPKTINAEVDNENQTI